MMIRFSILVSENPPFTVCRVKGQEGQLWVLPGCDRAPIQSTPEGRGWNQQSPSLLAPSSGFWDFRWHISPAATTPPNDQTAPSRSSEPSSSQASLIQVGDPAPLLPWYSPTTKLSLLRHFWGSLPHADLVCMTRPGSLGWSS